MKSIFINIIAISIISCNSSSNSQYGNSEKTISFDSFIPGIIKKHIKKLDADSVAIFVYDGQYESIRYAQIFKENNGAMKQIPIPAESKIEPLSLIKPFWAGILIQNGLNKSSDSIPYESTVAFYDYEIRDNFPRNIKYITLEKAVAYSSNTAMTRFVTNHKSKPCIESAIKKLASETQSNELSLPYASIGYGIQVPVLDLMKFYSDVALTIPSDSWSEVTLKEVSNILKKVVMVGTGKNLYSDSYLVRGKTATRTRHDNESNTREGLFIGFNEDKPNFVILVRVYNSSPMYYGSTTAGPIALDILKNLN